jgi:leucyl-tRNA synthetase
LRASARRCRPRGRAVSKTPTETSEVDRSRSELEWFHFWQREGFFRCDTEQAPAPFYLLNMFPYPKGAMHVAQARQFFVVDAIARLLLLQGHDVLSPYGFDAFGLPAEEAARRAGHEPAAWTQANIERYRRSWRAWGAVHDRGREVITSSPEYFRWTQWLFLELYRGGLAYRARAPVNRCRGCETVLANEQVTDATCQLCHGTVEEIELEQWFLAITRYADELLTGLDELDWPEPVKSAQRQWIGRGERLVLTCPLSAGGAVDAVVHDVTHLVGSFRVAIPSDHWAAAALRDGAVVEHPQSGEALEVDLRGDRPEPEVVPCSDEGTSRSRADECARTLKRRGLLRTEIRYRLRDWLVSRQRHWGTPIPIVHCSECGPVAVSEHELPVRLSLVNRHHQTLTKLPSFVAARCPSCGRSACRDTDTLDTFVDSSWYFLRFLDPHSTRIPFPRDVADRWLPVDLYVGGSHYAVSHLLYARFVVKALRDLGLVSVDEPFRRLFAFGTLRSVAYRCAVHGWRAAAELDATRKRCASCGDPVAATVEKMSTSRKNFVTLDDVIDQDGSDAARVATLFLGPHDRDLIWSPAAVAGARRWLRRIYGPVRTEAIRVRDVPLVPAAECSVDDVAARAVAAAMNASISGISRALASQRFHVAIARAMEATASILRYRPACSSGDERLLKRAVVDLAALIAPIAPFMAEELYLAAGGRGGVLRGGWPVPLYGGAEDDPVTPVMAEVDENRDR